MLSPDDLTELIIALTGLVAAIATLIRAFHDVHARLDTHDDQLAALEHLYLRSSTKVLPPDNPEGHSP